MRLFLMAFALMALIIAIGTLVAHLRYQRKQSAETARALSELWARKELEQLNKDMGMVRVPKGVTVVTMPPGWADEQIRETLTNIRTMVRQAEDQDQEPTATLERKARAISFEE